MKIKGLSIKSALNDLKQKQKITNLYFNRELSEVRFTNIQGDWLITKITSENTCNSCWNDTEEFMIMLNNEEECCRCEKCLLYALKNYDYCGWED